MVTLTIPSPLRRFCGGHRDLEVQGTTVAEVIQYASERYPDMIRFVIDESGRLHGWVRIYTGIEDVQVLQGLDTPVADGEHVHIVPCILD